MLIGSEKPMNLACRRKKIRPHAKKRGCLRHFALSSIANDGFSFYHSA